MKLFGSILTSSVWAADMPTRLVWITLLAMADAEGFVRASPSGLARVANVPLEDCSRALDYFLSPDTESGSKEDEGRRIRPLDGGWFVINYGKYRAMVDAENRKAQWREASKRHREKKTPVIKRQRLVIKNQHDSAQGEADAKADTDAEKAGTTRLPSGMALRPTEERFIQTFYAKADPVRLLDIRSQLSQALTIGTKYNGSLVRAYDAAHLDGVLGQVCEGPAMRDPNLAIIPVLKKLAETYLEVKSATEKATELPRGTP